MKRYDSFLDYVGIQPVAVIESSVDGECVKHSDVQRMLDGFLMVLITEHDYLFADFKLMMKKEGFEVKDD